MHSKYTGSLGRPCEDPPSAMMESLEPRVLLDATVGGEEPDITVDVEPPAVTIGFLDADPDPVGRGETLTLTAGDVEVGDPLATVQEVSFYRDANSDGVGQDEELLGTDDDGSDGWTWSGSVDWDAGVHTYLANATDDLDNVSEWVSVEGTVLDSIIIGTEEGAEARIIDYVDANGTRVNVKVLRGLAKVYFTGNIDKSEIDDPNDKLDIGDDQQMVRVEMIDSSWKTFLFIKARGGSDNSTTVGEIVGDTALGKLHAKRVNLDGEGIVMTDKAYVRWVFMNDLRDGADILMEGRAKHSITLKIHDVSEGSVIDIRRGPVSSIKFSGDFKGVLAVGVSSGPDGEWFTDDDFVETVVKTKLVKVAHVTESDATTGDPYGLLLSPGTRRVITRPFRVEPNVGAADDGMGFEALIVGLTPSITIDSVSAKGQSSRVRGMVENVSSQDYSVILYAMSDNLYIQPDEGSMLKITGSGRWQANNVDSGDLYAYVVRSDFVPEDVLAAPLDVDGVLVIAEAMYV